MVTKNPAQDKFKAPALTPAPGGLSKDSQAYVDETTRTGVSEVLVASEAVKTIRAAVNRVVLLYSHARQRGADIHAFIDDYTYRPVATMTQIFGTTDLVIKKVEEWKSRLVRTNKPWEPISPPLIAKANMWDPPSVARAISAISSDAVQQAFWKPKYANKRYKESSYKVESGSEGFHSRAFSDEDNLFGLVEPKVKKILGLEQKDEKMLAKLDTRKERRVAVRQYVSALVYAFGLRG